MNDDGYPIVVLQENLANFGTKVFERVDPVLVVAAQCVVTAHSADVICGAFNCSPLDLGVPKLRDGFDPAQLERLELLAHNIRALRRHRLSVSRSPRP
jgi:hypothetical protein